MNEEHKERLRNWKLKADQVMNDHWIRFVIFWMIFDAYMTEESTASRDEEKLRWFIENDNELKTIFKDHWAQPGYQHTLEVLKSHSPIRDMRPRYRDNRSVSLDDTDNDDQLFRFMYQIRCNTFHGGKDLLDRDDNRLTQCVEQLFNKPLSVYFGL